MIRNKKKTLIRIKLCSVVTLQQRFEVVLDDETLQVFMCSAHYHTY